MGSRVTVAGNVSATPDGQGQGESSIFTMDDSAAGTSYGDVRARQFWTVATLGAAGAAFVALDTPPIVQILGVRSLAGNDFVLRLNGAPAKVAGTGAAFGTIVAADSFTMVVDGVSTTVAFQAGDTTIAAVIARINAAANAIVASNDGAGNLVLTGSKTGGAAALAKAYQYGSIVLSGPQLAKLGLVAGTTYGAGDDVRSFGRLFLELSAPGAGLNVTKVEVSGSSDLAIVAAGKTS